MCVRLKIITAFRFDHCNVCVRTMCVRLDGCNCGRTIRNVVIPSWRSTELSSTSKSVPSGPTRVSSTSKGVLWRTPQRISAIATQQLRKFLAQFSLSGVVSTNQKTKRATKKGTEKHSKGHGDEIAVAAADTGAQQHPPLLSCVHASP